MGVFGFSTARTSAVMLVTSKGAAAVSGGSFVVFAATVTAIGVLPLPGLSMAIATCNTIGDSVVTGGAKWLGEFTEQIAKAKYSRVFLCNLEASF
jgi:aerobic C4-dicarboxylate transport protein